MISNGFNKKIENARIAKEKFEDLLGLLEKAIEIPGGKNAEASITVNSLDGERAIFSNLKDFLNSNQEYDNVASIYIRFNSYKYNKAIVRTGSGHATLTLHLDTPYLGLEVSAETTHITNAYNDLQKMLNTLQSKKFRSWNALPNSPFASIVFSLASAILVTLIVSNFSNEIADYNKQTNFTILFLVFLLSHMLFLIFTAVVSKKYNSIVILDNKVKTSRIFKDDAKLWVGFILTNIILQIVLIKTIK